MAVRMNLWCRVLSTGLIVALAGSAFADDGKISFNRDIRPILSDHCFQCHGPDEHKRQAGLRLDLKESATKAAESGHVPIVPGKSDTSELVARIITADADLQMPPASINKKLTASQIELLKRWIDQGAEYQGHWAFLSVERPAVPAVQNEGWARNPIDQFVLSRLQHEGLQPSPEASRETLIRRVTLDLTGLPPTPADVKAFLADQSPKAYETVVDRLLSSPRYGERMALQWLDFARYADSNGYQTDGSRYQWPWRDWVIKAFNQNQPFDQFTIEQLAGDLLPSPTEAQIVATGFNRNHRLNGEGGIIAEEWRVETVIDRVETTGMTWMALTLNCCRCHDHKYDPIAQREFYQFFSFFNNVAESGTLQGDSKNTDPLISVPTEEQLSDLKRLEGQIERAEKQALEIGRLVPAFIAAWEPDFKAKLAAGIGTVWQTLQPKQVTSEGGATLSRQNDGSYLAGGTNPQNDVYTIATEVSPGQFSGLLLECLPDPSLPMQSLGRYPNGNFVLSAIEAEISSPDLTSPLKARFSRAEATYSQAGWEIGLLLDDNPANGWAVDGPTRRDQTNAMFLTESPLTIPPNATLTVRLRHAALGQHNIGRFRLSMTSLPPSTVKLDGAKFPDSLKQILAIDAEKRSPDQKAELEKFFRANVDSPWKQAEAAVTALKEQKAKLIAAAPNVMVMKELPQPRDAFILIRGEYDKPGDKVSAGLPKAFPPLPPGTAPNRLGLAKWLVDPSHPLTARVWVNRAWERFFGTGLVKTSENFGSQADFPSHPELLDWLAAEFMSPSVATSVDPGTANQLAKPWDMKAIQKLIVMSATYRQSSHVTKELVERDAENRLLARGPRFRLSAEALRDQALSVSGLLVDKIGGPSVRPYMPEGVWDETSRYGDLRGYKHDSGEGLYRRTMYTIWKRTAAPPTMLLFDAPNREVCTVKRSRTNTPLQALSLLNEITYVEAARKLAERILKEGGPSTADRLTYGFQLTTSRLPTANELNVLKEGLAADIVRLKQDPEMNQKLLAFGDSKSAATLDPVELAAYTLTANVLLNLDEVITRE
eukprot:TRINITY_DN32_c1_g4_i1.p1 TRINITY_DN32_c1_g4~~TRINITY_DN32_c1_g4_i1.p1  ORF type:complete len:1053 (+),score=274.99 TRINITY_DN32_c1_g4_i1:413-3571(+)